MTPGLNTIYTGDCIEVMKTWPGDFIDTIITDPPYGLEFMGKDWDGDVPGVHFWTEMLRIAKPGAMLLAFGGTRTWHHLAMAIEGAGWVIRDCLMWLYGSGFPKSLDISKAIDKAKGVEREVLGHTENARPNRVGKETKLSGLMTIGGEITKPQTDLAKEWSGWGTALKPAWEPIILAMKPCEGTFAENAERWGVAGLNIDGSRIPTNGETICGSASVQLHDGWARPWNSDPQAVARFAAQKAENRAKATAQGRWPSNLLLDEAAAGMLDGVSGVSGVTKSGDLTGQPRTENKIYGSASNTLGTPRFHNGDSGGASRFFYVAKSCRAERNEGCEGMEEKVSLIGADGHKTNPMTGKPVVDIPRANHHPTVKPLELMKYLCTLTRTPTGGIVLDPFAGSGTTLWAAECHNRPWIGIELNPEYVAIANARIARERMQLKMAV